MSIETNRNRTNGNHRKVALPRSGQTNTFPLGHGELTHFDLERAKSNRAADRPLRVMKFGGTSVGDANCIAMVVDIIRESFLNADLIVVVSAMTGVTNKLVEAAMQAEAGNAEQVAQILKELRLQHVVALTSLSLPSEEQQRISKRMEELFQGLERLCKGTSSLGELTPRVRDAVSSLGERLCAPLVAAALQQGGVASQAVDATQLVITDSCHGAADPWIDLTRERCEIELLPLVRNRIVPIVTGFIGSTSEGVVTTLGRGGSDYSAAIISAATSADEVEIWTDVDGILTADPRLIPGARTIAEISYREAAELAYFGAKVLHPKTLRPLAQSGIPLWIRNTFAPEKPGTKITPEGSRGTDGVTALTAVSDASLINIGGPGVASVPDLLGRAVATTRELRTDVLLISQSSSQHDIFLVVPASMANQTVEHLRREFAEDLAYEQVQNITIDSTVAVITVVGKNMRGIPGIVGRTFCALGRSNIDPIAIAHGASESNISFVVAREHAQAALAAVHCEFRLGAATGPLSPEELISQSSQGMRHNCDSCVASAD